MQSLYNRTRRLQDQPANLNGREARAKSIRAGSKRIIYREVFIREWRQHRGLSLYDLAGIVNTTHATLSRIERGKQPYNQGLLERIADALSTDVTSLLMYPPETRNDLFALWGRASTNDRKRILSVVKAMIRDSRS